MKNEFYAIKEVMEAGRVTSSLKSKYFSGWKFGEIRDWLETNGLDRHMVLELASTEIALVTPFGILMQIRPSDNNQLGLWGGVLEDNEEPKAGAIRELMEECGLKISEEQLEPAGIDEHFHQYSNGDKACFLSYRFVVRFDSVPKITTDEESAGAVMVANIILDHQKEFVRKLLEEI